jgi:hypothetical protein
MNKEQEVTIVSLDSVIETKLVQNNVTEMVLSSLKEKYGGMKLKALDDKESYLELKAAAKDCAKVRTLAVKICKEGREDAVKTQKLWIAKEKEVVGKVAEVEDALDAEIGKFDAEVERKETEEKNRQEEAYINRQATLTRMGATFADGSFTLGEASFEANLIKGSSQDVWDESIVPKFQAEYEKIEAARVAQEKEKADREAEMKRQQEELEKQQAEFKRQQEEFERQKSEQERQEIEKVSKELEEHKAKMDAQNKSRMNQLMALGMKYNFNDKAFSAYDVFAAEIEITTFTDEQWNDLMNKITPVIAERKAKEQLEQERLSEEKRLADIDAAEKEAVRKEQQRIAEEEAKRQTELEAASDRKKWEEFIRILNKVEFYEMRSGQYRKKMADAKQKIESIIFL